MGLFELRNLVEAVILTVPALYLCIAFLPFGLTAKIIVTLVVVVPVGGFGLTVIEGLEQPFPQEWLDQVSVHRPVPVKVEKKRSFREFLSEVW